LGNSAKEYEFFDKEDWNPSQENDGFCRGKPLFDQEREEMSLEALFLAVAARNPAFPDGFADRATQKSRQRSGRFQAILTLGGIIVPHSSQVPSSLSTLHQRALAWSTVATQQPECLGRR
jgi:hypothetical protein